MPRTFVIAFLACGLVMGTASVFGEPRHRPMAEMHGGCASFQMDLQVELGAMKKDRRGLMAWPARGDHANLLAILSPVEISLLPLDHTVLTVEAKRAGDYAGTVPFRVPKSGRYRLSAGSSAWIEVVGDGGPVEPLAFEMQTECSALSKTVVYPLNAGVPYWLEVSAMTREITILLTEHETLL